MSEIVVLHTLLYTYCYVASKTPSNYVYFLLSYVPRVSNRESLFNTVIVLLLLSLGIPPLIRINTEIFDMEI